MIPAEKQEITHYLIVGRKNIAMTKCLAFRGGEGNKTFLPGSIVLKTGSNLVRLFTTPSDYDIMCWLSFFILFTTASKSITFPRTLTDMND